MQEQVKVQQKYLDLINQVFEIEKKAALLKEPNSISRNINKLKEMIENVVFNNDAVEQTTGFVYHSPLGEPYNETRTDCEASIAGGDITNLEIVEVIKPIIYLKQGPIKRIVQKGLVIAQSV